MTHQIRRSIIAGLAALPLASCGASSPPTAVAATPPFVYVANSKSDKISQYSAPASVFGALTPLAPPTVPTGRFPYGIAINPQGTSVYAADVKGNEVSQYTINPITARAPTPSPSTTTPSRNTASTQEQAR